ncbi:uncharacterized protein CEXT_331641 [Caerostris extrusa]|uniref:Snake toxin/toxin-like domain-containing protein n=1 Tax=Caerostris extrusa TaxID=172846 RepID=A0AAV4NE00_CAEEX|nr:uncharacterized protein CEXT_331641 [Caerostris extrusa]
MWIIGFLFLLTPSTVLGLECYVCDNQDSNYDKCTKTIKTCDIAEDRCLSEVRWGSTPYWDSTGKTILHIQNMLHTERQCKSEIKLAVVVTEFGIMTGNVECCHGDRCNYYVTSKDYYRHFRSSLSLHAVDQTQAPVRMWFAPRLHQPVLSNTMKRKGDWPLCVILCCPESMCGCGMCALGETSDGSGGTPSRNSRDYYRVPTLH